MGRITDGALPYTALRDAVLERLRDALASGRLKPGERLLEVELAQELGCSRAPVREAIRQLEKDGLVVSAPHKGAFVVKLSAQDAREIYSLRAGLEGMAALLVVKSGEAAVFDALQRLLDSMRASAAANEIEGAIRTDFEFHETLCQAAGNERLLGVWLNMRFHIRAFISATSLMYISPSEIVLRHQSVLEAMRAGDVQRAQWLLTHDILEAGEHVAARLASSV